MMKPEPLVLTFGCSNESLLPKYLDHVAATAVTMKSPETTYWTNPKTFVSMIF